MICAGYLSFDLPKKPAGDLAKEGDAASEVLEHMLHKRQIPDTASNGIYISDEMKFYVGLIRDDILSRVGHGLFTEQTIDWQTGSGIWIKGRYDVGFVDQQGNLCIEDLKYGSWTIVEPEENWQLISYAIGEIIRRGESFNEVRLTIHQPRAHHEKGISRTWSLPYNQLIEYKRRIEERLMTIAQGDRTLQTSEQCKYCEAANSCPAMNKAFHRLLDYSSDFFQDELTDKELSRQLDLVKRAEELVKIKKDSLNELGIERVKQGRLIPGYVQKESYTNYVWRDNISPEAIKIMTGVDVIEKKFMTPAKAKQAGVDKDLVAQLSTRRLKGMSLVKGDANKKGDEIFGTNNPQGVN